ncbi:HlyD family type I secretion periplasmic adaptor subunit [Sphingomonas elodea]|uniref:Membrane fusion protein (MFP) family protein n=2 Tax=Pseudomonadota TaxID=1224 RepID=Q7X2M0_SPHEL|nr:HlyD family type I secretion periplasmic adaptor subunit [Sphingomonas elodea]AAP57695.1 putative secretion protein [Sphingomonas elodea ATCC 31461]
MNAVVSLGRGGPIARKRSTVLPARADAYDTEFLPAALEIIERPVSPTARMTGRVMLAGLAITGAWLAIGRVEVVAPTQGRIAPIGETKIVQSPESGIVRRILVGEGQKVTKGQVLITLDPTMSAADAAQARVALVSAQLDAARNQAIIDALDGRGFRFAAPADASAAEVETHRGLARARLAQIEAILATGRSDSGAAVSAAAEAQAQVRKLEQSLPLLEQQIAANEAMAAKGYVSKLRVVEMRRQLISERQDLTAARASVARLGQQSRSASSQSVRTREEARAQVLQELVKAQDDVRARTEEVAKASLRSSFRELRAPVSGTISQLQVHTEGGVIEGAKPLLSLVPDNARLEAEVMVENGDIGFVRTGMPVKVKLQAFPYTRYGMIPGTVVGISPEAVQVRDGQPPVYKARIALDRGYILANGARVPLRPGMVASADIVTGKRTLLSYLVGPMLETGSDALHER